MTSKHLSIFACFMLFSCALVMSKTSTNERTILSDESIGHERSRKNIVKNSIFDRATRLLAIDSPLLKDEIWNCSTNLSIKYGNYFLEHKRKLGLTIALYFIDRNKKQLQAKLYDQTVDRLNDIPQENWSQIDVEDATHADGTGYLSEGDRDDETVVATKQALFTYENSCKNKDGEIKNLKEQWLRTKRRSHRVRSSILSDDAAVAEPYLNSHSELVFYCIGEQLFTDGAQAIAQNYNKDVALVFYDSITLFSQSLFKHLYTHGRAPSLSSGALASSAATDISYVTGKKALEAISGRKVALPELPIPTWLRQEGLDEELIEKGIKYAIKYALRNYLDRLFEVQYDTTPLL